MYEVIGKEYWSNCMIEALKAKIRNPRVKIYFCRPRIINHHFQIFHFMWSDGKADYDFSDLGEGNLQLYRSLLFKGVVRKFELGFAEKYTKYRNRVKWICSLRIKIRLLKNKIKRSML